MKICIYTDNHYAQYSSILRNRGSKYSVRLENQIESLNWVEELSAQKKCDRVVCLGDFFDKPELNAEELTALKSIKWNKDVAHMFLVGNHEMGSNDLEYSSSHVFESLGFQSIKYVDYEKIGNAGIIYLPYLLKDRRATLKQYKEDLTYDNQAEKYIVFSHNDIAGIRYGQYLSKDGFDIQDIYDNCDLFINGHLHNQTQINDKTINLGNLTGQNFSEDATKYSHCAAILDTETLKLELINNPYAFDFFKFDIDTQDQLDANLDLCKGYSVVTVKVPDTMLVETRQKLVEKSNIVQFRVITKVTKNTKAGSIEELVKVDHIQQFKDYCVQHIDNTEVLIDELSKL